MRDQKVILDANSFAYYFLLHNFKTSKQVKFYEQELGSFLYDFISQLKLFKYEFFDKDNKEIEVEHKSDEFIQNFTGEIIDCLARPLNIDQTEFYFTSESIAEMRKSYDNISENFKDAITDFETLCLYNAFFTPKIYSVYENGYKKLTKDFESQAEKDSFKFEA